MPPKEKTPLKTDSHPEGRDYRLQKKRNGLNSQSFIDCAAKPTKAKAKQLHISPGGYAVGPYVQ
jgi:hypothetical protein